MCYLLRYNTDTHPLETHSSSRKCSECGKPSNKASRK